MARARAHRRRERMLQELIHVLQAMASELQYRMLPLPQLFLIAAEQSSGMLSSVFEYTAKELQRQVAPDASYCLHAALEGVRDMPDVLRDKLMLLGKSLGRYDLQGQLSGMEAVSQLCKRDLEGLLLNRDARLRSYTTLGLCTGIALVILFI